MDERRDLAVTPEERAALGHLRGWCHDGSVCPICHEQNEAFKANRTLDQIISG